MTHDAFILTDVFVPVQSCDLGHVGNNVGTRHLQ